MSESQTKAGTQRKIENIWNLKKFENLKKNENLKKIENLENLYKNISTLLIKLNEKANQAQTQDGHYEDNSNAYMYILFVLTFYGRVYLIIFPMQGGLYWLLGDRVRKIPQNFSLYIVIVVS